MEARCIASAGYGIGYETLSTHRLYTRDSSMAPFVRGRLKTVLNAGQKRRALTNASESEGPPNRGVDPAGTSARCLRCGHKLGHSAARHQGRRNMWCQPCHSIRDRDANAGTDILFRTIMALVMKCTGNTGSVWDSTLPAVISLLNEAVADPRITGRQRITICNILRLLEGRSAGAEWRLPGAHKPGRQGSAGGEPVGGPRRTVPAETGRGSPMLPSCASMYNL